MNLNDVSTQLLFTTVPIWIEGKRGKSFGTGFIYAIALKEKPATSLPFLVTNAHVVEGASRGILEFVKREGEAPARGQRIRVELDGPSLTQFLDPANDIAVVPIGGVLNELESTGRGAFFRTIDPSLIPRAEAWSDLSAIEDVTFIGYPSGLYDQHNSTPVVRRGITATPAWNDFANTPSFLIDAGVFPGSSGSPVFILNRGAYTTQNGLNIGHRLLFLGILSESMIRRDPKAPDVFLGLGKVIKSTSLATFLEPIAERLSSAVAQPAKP